MTIYDFINKLLDSKQFEKLQTSAESDTQIFRKVDDSLQLNYYHSSFFSLFNITGIIVRYQKVYLTNIKSYDDIIKSYDAVENLKNFHPKEFIEFGSMSNFEVYRRIDINEMFE